MEKMNLQELAILVLTFCSTQVLADDLNGDTIEKRAPGWGKRDTGSMGSLGYLQSVISDLSRYDINNDEHGDIDLDKRRPGWGKRNYAAELDMTKRKPGWGKRAFDYDLDTIETKRTPGWGKRSFTIGNDLSEETVEKRRPGWGKRNMYDEYEMDKRRPGWGKRAPGWGKRSTDKVQCQNLINDIRILRLKLYQLSEELPEACPNTFLADDDVGS